MMKSFVALCAVAVTLGVSGCSGWGRGETVGTLGGAAIGGYAGHEAGTDYDKKHQ